MHHTTWFLSGRYIMNQMEKKKTKPTIFCKLYLARLGGGKVVEEYNTERKTDILQRGSKNRIFEKKYITAFKGIP